MQHNKFAIAGIIVDIKGIEIQLDGFVKRELILRAGRDFPQDLRFEFLQQNAYKLEPFGEGEEVLVQFNLKGSEFNDRLFTNLIAYQIEGLYRKHKSVFNK